MVPVAVPLIVPTSMPSPIPHFSSPGYDYNPAAGAKTATDVGYRPFFMDDNFIHRGRAALAAGDPYWLAVKGDADGTGTPAAIPQMPGTAWARTGSC